MAFLPFLVMRWPLVSLWVILARHNPVVLGFGLSVVHRTRCCYRCAQRWPPRTSVHPSPHPTCVRRTHAVAVVNTVNGDADHGNAESSCSTEASEASKAPVASATPLSRLVLPDHQVDAFTSPVSYVYIEDTDAYGVMYNANYVRAYDRAIQTLTQSRPSLDFSAISTDSNTATSACIVGIAHMKFKSAPTLGSSYVIVGRYVSTRHVGRSNCRVEVWNLEMHRVHDRTDGICASPLVYNTAHGVHIWMPCASDTDVAHAAHAPMLLPEPTLEGSMDDTLAPRYHTTHSFAVYRDELDVWPEPSTPTPSSSHTFLPLFRVLNFWERARSTLLGGPRALQRLQLDHNILFVVTGMDNLQLVWSEASVENATNNPNIPPPMGRPGDTHIHVETDTVWKRRGTVLDCHQTACTKDGATASILARGVVKLLAIDATTKRPVRELPSWVREQLEQAAN